VNEQHHVTSAYKPDVYCRPTFLDFYYFMNYSSVSSAD